MNRRRLITTLLAYKAWFVSATANFQDKNCIKSFLKKELHSRPQIRLLVIDLVPFHSNQNDVQSTSSKFWTLHQLYFSRHNVQNIKRALKVNLNIV